MEYGDFVEKLCKKGKEIVQQLTADDCNLIHMSMGVSGEAGELTDAIKKYTIYRKPLDLENVIEELGDLEFYMQGIRNALSLTRAEILRYNIDKLEKRYDQGSHSDKQAQERADKS